MSLLITLFLRDRKQEIGIYLAIGDKKGRVTAQFLTEVLGLSLVAITLSLFTGSLLANNFSQTMVQNNLMTPMENVSVWANSSSYVP